jgi:filamentous hemagglutinin family protein
MSVQAESKLLSRPHLVLSSLLLGLILSSLASATYAQVITSITPDGTLGTTVAPPVGNVYNIDGGTIKGTNQFHSFGQLNVGTGDIASFNGPAGIQNIISRVTGGSGSQIDGTLRSTISGANLFLMNPSGILFGPNAQLDVSGSFHATTANYIALADGVHFNAVPSVAADALLTTAAPAAFGFLTSNPAPIDVQTGVFDFDTFFTTGDQGASYTNILQVPVGQTLSFVGGTVNVGSGFPPQGFVLAPAGRVNLVSVASPGEASFNNDGSLNVGGFAQLGQINIKGNSFIDAKDVFIRSGQLTIEDATIFPGLMFLLGQPFPAPDGGSVDIGVSGGVTITATGGPVLNLPGVQTFAGSPGGLFPGDVPVIRINADALSMSGPGASITAARLGPENLNPPEVTINANTVTVANGASINLLNFFEGSGGTLTLTTNNLTLSNDGSTDAFTGIAAQGFFHPGFAFVFLPFLADADSGSMAINVGNTLTMSGRAEITSDSFAFGNAGNITVNTHDAFLSGHGTISSQSGLAGKSGDIELTATGQIQMSDGFRISAATGGSGDAGNINISAAQSITLTGADTRIISQTAQPSDDDPPLNAFAQQFDGVFQANLGIPIPDYPSLRAALNIAPHNGDLMDVLAALNDLGLTAVPDLTPGDAGKISISTPVLTMNADTRLETSTAWDGNAGQIGVNVGSLSLNDGASIRSRSGTELRSAIDGSIIGPGVGTGNAGNVALNATGTISVSGQSPTSGAGSTVTTTTFGDGNGGTVTLNANEVQILDGGIVSADSGGTLAGQFLAGSGLTGDVTVNAGNQIIMTSGSISTRAVTSDGGNISLSAPSIINLTDSQITTSVESGVGGGGNISVDPNFLVLNNGQITANAFGGPGGNIKLVAGNFIPSANSVITASSALSTQGTIIVQSPGNEIANGIAQLPANIVDVSGLLPERCAARRTGAQNSFVVAGRGGLPVDPDGYLPSFNIGGTPAATRAGGSGTVMSDTGLQYDQQLALAMANWSCGR